MAHLLRSLFFFLFLTPGLSLAFSYFIPQGQRESLMGNVGIGLPASEGAPIYNPASAAGLSSDRISASVSLLNITSTKMGDENTFKDRSTSPSFYQIPGLIAGYNKTSWGNLGFFINTDYMLTFDKLIIANTTYGTFYSEMEMAMNSLNVGLLFANSTELTKDLQLQYGVTASMNMLELQTSIFSKSYVTSSNTYISNFNNTNNKTTNLLTRLGLLLSSTSYSVGAYYQPKGTHVSSSYSQFAYQVATDGTVVDDSTTSGAPLATPETYGLGVTWQPLKQTKILLDANLSRETLESQTGDPIAEKPEERVESIGIGLEQGLSSGNNIYTGLSHSVLHTLNPTTTWLLSGGFDYKISFIKNYIGAYYSLYTTPANDKTTAASTTITYAGVIIASQYAF